MAEIKRVVYTVLTGGYDRLQQPSVVEPGWDYVCFTDAPAGRDGVWELRPIPYDGTPLLRARWVKMHPHVLLPEYSYSVFMDANLCIRESQFYRLAERNLPLAGLPHPSRDCVFDELRYCYLKDMLPTCTALRIHRRLNGMGMPRHAGLFETNVLLREHNAPEIVAFDEAWWAALQASCPRDQLSFTPTLQTQGLTPELLFGPGLHARNVSFVAYTNHPRTGKENVPGRLNGSNLKYNLRLLWRKTVLLLCLR